VSQEKPVLVIEAGRVELHYWRDLWRYRQLFYFLAWRDILVRYKQTVIGILWAVIRPMMTIVVFTFIFGRLAKLPSDGVPYPILVGAATLPWQLFATAFAEVGNSLVSNAHLISKVYFPRLIIPASAVAAGLIDFLISMAILVSLMLWYGIVPSWRILALPIFIVVALGAAIGTGLWIAALNVKYRDFRHLIPFLLQVGLFISPIGFSSAIVPERWRPLYSLNPMSGVIDGFRWSVLGVNVGIYWPGVLMSLGLIVLLLVTGVAYFRKTERTFVDVI